MSQMQRKPGFWDRLIGREAAEPPKPAADPAASRSEGTPDFTTATGADPAPAQARATQASPETPAEPEPELERDEVDASSPGAAPSVADDALGPPGAESTSAATSPDAVEADGTGREVVTTTLGETAAAPTGGSD